MNIKQLIEGCKKSDRHAQKKLYTQYKDILFALCLKYCKNRAEAEDTLQDSFITIFRKINSYKGKGSFEGWMKRITINKAIDKYKKEPFFDTIDNHQIEEDTTINDTHIDVSLAKMLEFIQELPSRYRLVFNLYQLDGYSHQEISDELNISVGTSKSNFHRAKVILKEKIITYTTSHKNSIANG